MAMEGVMDIQYRYPLLLLNVTSGCCWKLLISNRPLDVVMTAQLVLSPLNVGVDAVFGLMT